MLLGFSIELERHTYGSACYFLGVSGMYLLL